MVVSQRFSSRVSWFFLLALPIAVPGWVAAQTAPDGGTLLRGIESSLPPKLPAPASGIAIPGGETPTGGDLAIRVHVKSFRLKGATLIPEKELLDQLRDMVGRELSLVQLKLAAIRLAEYYREKGFLAKVLLPPQTIEDGIVDLVIVEARLGGADIGAPRPERADAERALQMLLAQQPLGEPIRADAILHGLRVINETPGFSATALVQPGGQEGETNLLLKVEDTPLLSGLAMVDNHGAKATGIERTIASLNLNNPSGAGDQATLMALGTSGNFFTRLGYSVPIGHRGTRVGISATRLDYRLGGDFAQLNANGWARLENLAVSHPVVRAPEGSLTLSIALDQKHFVNNANGTNTSNKFIHLLSGGLSGEWSDGLDGIWQGSATVFLGKTDLGLNRDDLEADRTSARTHGHFSKIAWTLARNQKIGDYGEIAINLSGQHAENNLDSGERFSLGGPTGVRAYPVSEASGDEGWLFAAEYRHRFGDEVQVAAFLDAGGILLHKHPWSGWNSGTPGQKNRYMLNGGGLSATWKQRGNFVMTAGWAMRMGGNPGEDAKGKDNDGTRRGQRVWWQLTKMF